VYGIIHFTSCVKSQWPPGNGESLRHALSSLAPGESFWDMGAFVSTVEVRINLARQPNDS
jgi:hypothetical protein